MKKIIFILLFSTFIFSCKKEAFIQPDYIVFGAIQGSCANGCRFAYYLDKNMLKQDVSVKYFSTHLLTNFSTTLSNEKYELVKDLINKVPSDLTHTNRTLFIDLNAANPNLWYAEIKLNNRIYNWTFDNSPKSTPTYLQPFAAAIINACISLQ